jgi:hypothetical protein
VRVSGWRAGRAAPCDWRRRLPERHAVPTATHPAGGRRDAVDRADALGREPCSAAAGGRCAAPPQRGACRRIGPLRRLGRPCTAVQRPSPAVSLSPPLPASELYREPARAGQCPPRGERRRAHGAKRPARPRRRHRRAAGTPLHFNSAVPISAALTRARSLRQPCARNKFARRPVVAFTNKDRRFIDKQNSMLHEKINMKVRCWVIFLAVNLSSSLPLHGGTAAHAGHLLASAPGKPSLLPRDRCFPATNAAAAKTALGATCGH